MPQPQMTFEDLYQLLGRMSEQDRQQELTIIDIHGEIITHVVTSGYGGPLEIQGIQGLNGHFLRIWKTL